MGSVSISEYETKKGKKYRIQWRDDNGGRGSKKCGQLKSTAIQMKEKKELELLTGGTSLLDRTVKASYKEYMTVSEKTKKPNTMRIIKHALREFVEKYGGLLMESLNPKEIERFKNSLLKTHNVNGANIIIRNIKTFLASSVRSGYLSKSPGIEIKQFPRQPVARRLSRKELAHLMRCGSRKLRRSYFVMVYLGLRLGEYLGINPKNFNPTTRRLTVNGKTGPRTISVGKRIARILPSAIGIWHTRDGIEQAHRVAVQKAKIGRIRIHDMRHTFASAYIESGGSAADGMRQTGHKTDVAFRDYLHLAEGYLDERMENVRI